MTTSPYDDEQAGPACEQSPSSSKGDPAGFAGWTKEGGPPLPPLMQHPTASVAAAAAMGFGMASHFAGFMLGAMQGFMEAAQKAAATAEAERQAGHGTESAGKAEGAPGRAVEPGIADEAAPETDAGLPVEPVTSINAAAAEATAAVMERASAAVAETTPRTANEKRPAAKPVRVRRGKVADDLKKISGIGPKLEQVLKSFEVTRFSEIAAWDENDIARFDRELNVSGRIVRDRWVEQAKVLAKS
ncbi:NADH:ubiquinone oxidoreductase [Rhizobium sp. NFR03]|uniref:NADH:ubiquinone oxidoreductase n=1 Tax=Rhizobium sp. NFR03 TaxID=1566263 RepID=UPI0008C69C18|nr:NADH:ubiquinone oxidoreductase [Rhizobium sp. NFR03]SES10867.1 NADH-quinone oxidoreductase subunit E [Rhizobium sp. NFR03]